MVLFLTTLYALLFVFSCSLFSAEYQINDKKLLELKEDFTNYDKNKDLNLESIIPYSTIANSMMQKPKKIKLLYCFKAFSEYFSLNPKAKNDLENSKPKNIYFMTGNSTENYYGINHNTLKGRNLIGQIVQKMRDNSYTQRIQQKIDVSNNIIEELNTSAFSKQKPYFVKQNSKNLGWQNIENAIYFYDKDNGYYEFTNFFPSEVYADELIWPTSEHYYQAMKFTTHQKIVSSILIKKAAHEAFEHAAANKLYVDSDWQSRSLNTMIKIVWLKFNQHKSLKTLLLNTGDKILVEDAGANDAFYGAGKDYKGANWLGCILMAVRDKLRTEEQTDAPASPTVPSNPTISSTNPPKIQQSTGQSNAASQKRIPQKPAPQEKSSKQGFWAWLLNWFASFFS